MSAETTAGTDRLVAVPDPWLRHRPNDRRFWIGVACVAILHVVALFGAGHANPRIMGEKDGDKDALAVDIVSAEDLARATAPQPVTPPVQPVQPQAAQPQPPSPPETPLPAEQPPTPAVEQPPPQPPQKKVADIPPDKEAPDLFSLPDPTTPGARPAPPREPHKAQPHKPPAPQARLSPPLVLPDPSTFPSGRAAAATRPPGITRTGENDEFGRGVIRALRQTMPSPNGLTGRVTIRLLLSENGNLAEVRLLSGADPILNQSVVFASKQSSFPLPPKGATVADRTFLVTYIYR